MSFNPGSGTLTYRGDLSMVLTGRMTSLSHYVAGKVLPVVPVAARQDYYMKVEPGPLMDAPNNNRAPGASYPEITFKISQAAYDCKSRGLMVKIPQEHSTEFRNSLALQEMGGYVALLQMLNSHEKRVADLVFNRTTWPVAATTGYDASQPWDNHSGANPVDDVLLAKAALVGNIGALATTGVKAVMSWYTAHHAMLCDQIREKLGYKYKENAPANPVWAAQLLAEALGLEEVIIGGLQYKSGGTDEAPTGTNFWNDDFCMVFKSTEVTTDGEASMPANRPVVAGLGACFQWNEMGELIEYYEFNEPNNKSDYGRLDQYTDEKIVMSSAGFLLGNLRGS